MDAFNENKETNSDAQGDNQDSVGIEYNGKVWNKEDVLNKFQNADKYIEELKQEVEQLKSQKAGSEKLDVVLDKLSQLGEAKPVQESEGNTTQSEPVKDDVSIESTVEALLKKREAEKSFSRNVEEVNSKLSQVYGDKAADVVASKAKELGMTIEEAKRFAGERPKAFAKLFIDESAPKGSNSIHSSVNTLGVTHNNGAKNKTRLSEIRSGKDMVSAALERVKKYAN